MLYYEVQQTEEMDEELPINTYLFTTIVWLFHIAEYFDSVGI